MLDQDEEFRRRLTAFGTNRLRRDLNVDAVLQRAICTDYSVGRPLAGATIAALVSWMQDSYALLPPGSFLLQCLT